MTVKKLSSSRILPPNAYGLTALDTERFAAEAALGMVPPHSAGLSRVSQAVPAEQIVTAAIQEVIIRLFKTATGHKTTSGGGKAKRTLVGLAAPQIGEQLRIIIIDTKINRQRKGASKLECFVNPEIIWRSAEKDEGHEGCFSTGPVWGLVRRPVAVKIKAFTPDGLAVERVFEGFTARIVQHEIDHLNGIRFPERIRSDKKRHWVHSEEVLAYRDKPQSWQRYCSVERWNDLKQGVIS
jgi:peptide deformylase